MTPGPPSLLEAADEAARPLRAVLEEVWLTLDKAVEGVDVVVVASVRRSGSVRMPACALRLMPIGFLLGPYRPE
ncbi:hypothetical protein [Micromonospora chersina]|uniref:hypothetical protein n=1 Tax=Micromonospora chersina TaxID=47854 RepID=UPI0037216047